jgi:hypothetical protein
MRDARTAQIDDSGQQAALSQEVRQARVPVCDASERGQYGLRLQLRQDIRRGTTDVDVVEVGFVYQASNDAKFSLV